MIVKNILILLYLCICIIYRRLIKYIMNSSDIVEELLYHLF